MKVEFHNKMNFGKAIKIVRSARNIPQSDLARKVDLDPSYISLIEKNKRIPSTNTLHKISDVLNVPFYLLILLASDKNKLNTIEGAKKTQLAELILDVLLENEQHK